MIYEKMIEDGVLNPGDCSVDTIQRYIRNSLRNGQGETLVKERRTQNSLIHVMAMKLIPVIHFIFTMKIAHTGKRI